MSIKMLYENLQVVYDIYTTCMHAGGINIIHHLIGQSICFDQSDHNICNLNENYTPRAEGPEAV